MKALLSIIFLLCLFTLQSCNQTGLGAVTAVKNLVTTPYRGVKSAISNYEYAKIQTAQETQEQEVIIPPSPRECVGTPIFAAPENEEMLSNFREIFEETRQQVCSCKAWGSCQSDTCSCDTLCPNNFDIFKRHTPISENSDRENSMAFRNIQANELAETKGTRGYCWGHASLTSKFNRLAFFEEEPIKMRVGLWAPPESQMRKESLEFYKKIIDDIVDNKARKIPGFRSLREFSRNPELQTYLAEKMAQNWANNAMTFQGLSTTLGINPMPKEDAQEFLEEVKTKIDNNQQPQIVFTNEGKVGATHAVLVSDYMMVNGQIILCIRDNEINPDINKECGLRMGINEEDKLTYTLSGWEELGSAKLAHNDNADAVAQFHSLREYCATEKDCPLNEEISNKENNEEVE